MKIRKQKIDNMSRCYSCTDLIIDNELHLIFAEEEKDGKCYEYYGADFKKKRVVWEKGGGTMSLVPIPDTNGEFLATIAFNRGFDAAGSKIVWCKLIDDEWKIHDFVSVPYLHRFDIFQTTEKTYLVGGVLCETKTEREDWSSPGKVIYAEMPKDPSQKPVFQSFDQNIFKNHGYYKAMYKGEENCFFAGEQGVFRLYDNNGKLNLEKIFSEEISDMAFIDIDNDGQEEMLTIAPFHGNHVQIYKEKEGQFHSVYKYNKPVEFAHAICAGKILGKNSFVFGVRKENKELVIVQYDNAAKEYVEYLVDQNIGTANVKIVNLDGCDILVASNHTINEAAIYYITE